MKNPIQHSIGAIAGAAALAMMLHGLAFAAVDHIRWGSEKGPLDSLTVTWRSTATTGQMKWGYTSSFEKGLLDGNKRNDNTLGKYLFDCTIAKPNPGKIIYYSIKDGSSWTTAKTFRTAVDPKSNKFSFITLGDSRGNESTDDPVGWGQHVDKNLKKVNADFCLFTGDVVQSGSKYFQYDGWFKFGQAFIEKTLIFHSLGNHDFRTSGLAKDQYVLPGNERWFSFEYANALFICLNSDEADNATQLNFLRSELAAAGDGIQWIFVWFHRPFFSSSTSKNDKMKPYLNTWWKAFDDFGVDVVITACNHNYSRSPAMNLSVSATSPVKEFGSKPGQGRLNIVTGGAGTDLDGISTTKWFIKEAKKIHHHVRFSIDSHKLAMDVYDLNGTKIDHLSLEKEPVSVKFCQPLPVANASFDVEALSLASKPGIIFRGTWNSGQPVELQIVNSRGRLVETINATSTANTYWNGTNRWGTPAPSGIYWVTARKDDQATNSRFILVR